MNPETTVIGAVRHLTFMHLRLSQMRCYDRTRFVAICAFH